MNLVVKKVTSEESLFVCLCDRANVTILKSKIIKTEKQSTSTTPPAFPNETSSLVRLRFA